MKNERLKRLWRFVRAPGQILHARAALAELAKTNGEIASAISNAAAGRVTDLEAVQIARIEDLRNRLSRCSTELEIIDYGAGSADAGLTDEEMRGGRMVRRTVGQTCALTSKRADAALLLFSLVRQMRPNICIELGTSVGISASYLALALKLNGAGRLITLEGDASVAAIARKNLQDLGFDNADIVLGRFQDTLAGVLSAHPTVDFAFIDGHHDQKATLDYFRALLPHLTNGSLVVFDDIQWSAGMKAAWAAIRRNERVHLSVDLGSMGVVSVGDDGPPRHFEIAFDVPFRSRIAGAGKRAVGIRGGV
jgi:predicted O-methyltransferase YrrM